MSRQKTTLMWEDPPERPPKYDWQKISAELRQRPMDWALIYEKDRRSVAVAVRQGSIAAVHPNLGFETTTSNNVVIDGYRTCTLHMRFNPEKVDGLRAALRKDK